MTYRSGLVKQRLGITQCDRVSTYSLCDPLAVLPSPEGNMASPWKVLVEVPSNDPDTFLSAVRVTSLEALRIRLGDEFYMEVT